MSTLGERWSWITADLMLAQLFHELVINLTR